MQGRARHLNTTEDRAAPFRDFLRHRGYAVQDLDLFYWGKRNGRVVPVAILEITRLDHYGGSLSPVYLERISERFHTGGQGEAVLEIASRLGCPVFVVLFADNLERFWIYCLSDPAGWLEVDPAGYDRWVHKLFSRVRDPEQKGLFLT